MMDFNTDWFTAIQSAHLGLGMTVLGACLLATLLHRIGRRIVLRLSKPQPFAHTVLRNIDRAVTYALPLLFVQLVLRSAPDDLRAIEPLRHFSSILLILALSWLLMRAVRGVALAIIAQHPVHVADNLQARRIHTQTKVLMRSTMALIVILGSSAILMTFPSVRTIGASLLASAGVAGLVAGMAARPVLGNLIAGVQIALTQPIRLDDVLIIDNEWGWVEEITGTYVVMRLWDRRRQIVPLQWFIEHPFQNWTRTSADIIGSVFWWVDYRLPLEPVRQEIQRLCAQVPHWWDGEVALLQVTESGPHAMQLRALVTARNSPDCWDLRCHIREGVIDFIQREYPQYLPTLRAEITPSANQPASL